MSFEYAALFPIILIGYMVGAAVGFGSAIISLTFSVLLFPISLMVPVIVPLNIVICLYLAIRHRSGIDVQALIKRILPLTIAGMPLGLWLFGQAEAGWMKPLFGAFVLFLALFELYRHFHNPPQNLSDPKSKASGLWLLVGGVVQGLWVSGGPLIAYWASYSLPDKRVFRSTLSAVWLILNLILLIGHLTAGRIDSSTLMISLQLSPALALGIFIGEGIHNKLPERGFRIFVYSVLLFAGTAIMFKG